MSGPQKSDWPVGAGQVANANTTETASIVAPYGDDDNAQRKLQDRLIAELALAKHTAWQLASGGYIVTAWGHAKELPDLHALAHFVRRVRGRA